MGVFLPTSGVCAIIQFWQIWQNDVFTEKLEWEMERPVRLCREAMDLEDFYLKEFELTVILISDVILYFCVVDTCK